MLLGFIKSSPWCFARLPGRRDSQRPLPREAALSSSVGNLGWSLKPLRNTFLSMILLNPKRQGIKNVPRAYLGTLCQVALPVAPQGSSQMSEAGQAQVVVRSQDEAPAL